MTVTSMLFLFVFLPFSLILYYISNDKAKEYVLLGLSLLFYSVGCIDYLLLFVFAIIVTVTIGRLLTGEKNNVLRHVLLSLGVLFNVGILVYYKYTNWGISTINQIFGSNLEYKSLVLPLGISFFTFKAISYLADVYLGKAVLDENPVHDMLYLSFFAQIQSGPLTRYNDMCHCNAKSEKKFLFSDGVYRFLIGFNKKVLIANVLANITNEVFSNSIDNISTSYVWLGSICYSLQLFFDFAGYSDMAIGISEMFGYHCVDNFNFPYMTESVAKFWRRWHISLSQWFRDYVYIPLGGSKSKNKYRVYTNLLVVWLLTGIWHGASWNFIVWGIGYYVLISFERATGLPDKFQSKLLKLFYRIFTLLFINLQWVIFRTDDLISALKYIKKMFIYDTNALAVLRTRFLIKDYFGFIVIAIFLCFPVVSCIGKRLEKNIIIHSIYEILIGCIVCASFVWAISFVVAGQNNPFAYADF